jgi:hypothetical protein
LDCGTRHKGSPAGVAFDERPQSTSRAAKDANLPTQTRRTVVAAILFTLPLDEPLRKEYLLRRWRGDDY